MLAKRSSKNTLSDEQHTYRPDFIRLLTITSTSYNLCRRKHNRSTITKLAEWT